MRLAKHRELNLNKVFYSTIVVNGMQVAAAASVVALSLISGGKAFIGLSEQILLFAMALIVIWGAVLDIAEARAARRVGQEADMLEAAYAQLEALNNTMRAQRHDFINHLQVVYSLTELGETAEALEYIHKVHADIQRVGRTLKTAHPSINALLAAKLSDCERRGIAMSLEIKSMWRALPVPGWEMCRVLGNLIDNAIDALRDAPNPRLAVEMDEEDARYLFCVSNNGPMIEPLVAPSIFSMGFSTKRAGRGMGLTIVADILRAYGGDVSFSSDAQRTAFRGSIPKTVPVEGSRDEI